jgi:hypothetical protein
VVNDGRLKTQRCILATSQVAIAVPCHAGDVGRFVGSCEQDMRYPGRRRWRRWLVSGKLNSLYHIALCFFISFSFREQIRLDATFSHQCNSSIITWFSAWQRDVGTNVRGRSMKVIVTWIFIMSALLAYESRRCPTRAVSQDSELSRERAPAISFIRIRKRDKGTEAHPSR